MFFRRCVETTAMTSGYYILYIYIKYHMTYMTWLETLIFIFRAMFFFFFRMAQPSQPGVVYRHGNLRRWAHRHLSLRGAMQRSENREFYHVIRMMT